MMKKYILFAALAAALLTGCERVVDPGKNDANKQRLEAWIKINHPDARKTPMGAYVLEETVGSGEALGDEEHSPYVRVNYVAKTLDGTIVATNSEVLAKQLGTYQDCNFYGPDIWTRPFYGIPAGVEEALASMNVGGKKTVMIPGWLLSSEEHRDAEDYFKNASGTDAVYTIEALERIPNIVTWEVDSLGSYLQHNYPSVSVADSLKFGFYYVRTGEPTDTCGFKKDTTLYINYIGRLLNGKVFDTNIKDTAKFYGIYNPGGKYGPSEVSGDPDYKNIKLGSSSVIDGFALTIANMHSFEKGTGIFCSARGYEANGSGEKIPPYSPLRFDIEIVEQ